MSRELKSQTAGKDEKCLKMYLIEQKSCNLYANQKKKCKQMWEVKSEN